MGRGECARATRNFVNSSPHRPRSSDSKGSGIIQRLLYAYIYVLSRRSKLEKIVLFETRDFLISFRKWKCIFARQIHLRCITRTTFPLVLRKRRDIETRVEKCSPKFLINLEMLETDRSLRLFLKFIQQRVSSLSIYIYLRRKHLCKVIFLRAPIRNKISRIQFCLVPRTK